MSTKFKYYDPDGIYFISTAVVNWIDVLTRRVYKDLFIGSLEYCVQQKGLIVYAYVLMSNHFHLIIGKKLKEFSFSDIMRDLKKFTAMQIIKKIKENRQESRKEWMLRMFEQAGRQNGNNTWFQFWQQDNHPISLEGGWIDQKLDYIHQNPVRAGWVDRPEEYYYSSARNYAGKLGAMKVVSVYDGKVI